MVFGGKDGLLAGIGKRCNGDGDVAATGDMEGDVAGTGDMEGDVADGGCDIDENRKRDGKKCNSFLSVKYPDLITFQELDFLLQVKSLCEFVSWSSST